MYYKTSSSLYLEHKILTLVLIVWISISWYIAHIKHLEYNKSIYHVFHVFQYIVRQKQSGNFCEYVVSQCHVKLIGCLGTIVSRMSVASNISIVIFSEVAHHMPSIFKGTTSHNVSVYIGSINFFDEVTYICTTTFEVLPTYGENVFPLIWILVILNESSFWKITNGKVALNFHGYL